MKFSPLSVAVAVLLAGSTEALFSKPPKQVKPNLVDGFVWRDPFKSAAIESFDSACEVTRTFSTLEYTLHDLMDEAPKGLKAWSAGLKKVFAEREYPGGWSGYDRHGYDRAILRMAYTEVPIAVREWIEEQERSGGEGKGLYAVFPLPQDAEDSIESVVGVPAANQVDRKEDKLKTVIFAPGALYHILPLWVAEGSNCQDELLDLSKYKPQVASGNVVGWLTHSQPDGKQADFTVTVKSIKERPAESASEGVNDDAAASGSVRDEL